MDPNEIQGGDENPKMTVGNKLSLLALIILFALGVVIFTKVVGCDYPCII